MGLPAVSSFGRWVSGEQLAILSEPARGVIALPDTDKAKALAPYGHALSKAVWVRVRRPAMPECVADPEYLSLNTSRRDLVTSWLSAFLEARWRTK